MKKTIIKLMLLLLLSFTFVTLCANNCYGEDSGESKDQRQTAQEEERRQPKPSTSQQNEQNAVEPKFTYPVEDTIIEVNLGNRAAMSVQTDGLPAHAYVWQKYQDGDWIAVDQGIAGGNDIYTTPYAVEKKHDGEQYRCEVEFHKAGDAFPIKTSPIFTIKVREKKETSESSSSRVPSSSQRNSNVVSSLDPDHEHHWKEETKTVNEYQEVTTITYRCKGCNFSTTEKRAMMQHVDETQAQKGHGGFRDDYVFEYKTLPINGYACNGCNFTTKDKAAMEAHDAANQPVAGHTEYLNNVPLGYTTIPGSTTYRCNNCADVYATLAEITEHMDDCPNHVISTGCRCMGCSAPFASYEDWEAHTEFCSNAEGYDPFFTCNVCSRSFADEGEAYAHEAAYAGGYTTNTTPETTSTLFGYKCKSCDFSSYSLNAIRKHLEENPGIEGHGGYQTNVQIGTEERPIFGYKCIGCNFTTKKKSEIERHNEKNQAQVGHGGYTATEQTKNVKTGEKKVKTGYRICTICKAKEAIGDDTVRTN